MSSVESSTDDFERKFIIVHMEFEAADQRNHWQIVPSHHWPSRISFNWIFGLSSLAMIIRWARNEAPSIYAVRDAAAETDRSKRRRTTALGMKINDTGDDTAMIRQWMIQRWYSEQCSPTFSLSTWQLHETCTFHDPFLLISHEEICHTPMTVVVY